MELVHSLSVSFRFQESQTQGGARQVMRPYKWRDVWQQENHTLVLMIRLLLSVLVHAMQFSRTLSSQIAVSVSNGRVWVWLSVWGRGGRQAARAGQRTEERKVNTPCLLLVYFLITAHLLNYNFVHLALVAGMPRLSCAPCGRVPLATANPFCSSVLPLSQTYQGLSHTHSKVPTK